VSTELNNAVQSAIDSCCQSFASGVEPTQEEAIARALQSALVDPSQFEAALEGELRAIPNLTAIIDKATLLKLIGDLWDSHVAPWDFPFLPDAFEATIKAAGRSLVLYVAGVVIDRIFGT
jgi:hypothetical protein